MAELVGTTLDQVSSELECDRDDDQQFTYIALEGDGSTWSGFGKATFAFGVIFQLLAFLGGTALIFFSPDFRSKALPKWKKIAEAVHHGISLILLLIAISAGFGTSFSTPKVSMFQSVETFGGRVVFATDNITAAGSHCYVFDATAEINHCGENLQEAMNKEDEYLQCLQSSPETCIDVYDPPFDRSTYEWIDDYHAPHKCTFQDANGTEWTDHAMKQNVSMSINGSPNESWREDMSSLFQNKNLTLMDCTSYQFTRLKDRLKSLDPDLIGCERLNETKYTCAAETVLPNSTEKYSCIDSFIDEELKSSAGPIAEREASRIFKRLSGDYKFKFWFIIGQILLALVALVPTICDACPLLEELSRIFVSEGLAYFMILAVQEVRVEEGCIALPSGVGFFDGIEGIYSTFDGIQLILMVVGLFTIFAPIVIFGSCALCGLCTGAGLKDSCKSLVLLRYVWPICFFFYFGGISAVCYIMTVIISIRSIIQSTSESLSCTNDVQGKAVLIGNLMFVLVSISIVKLILTEIIIPRVKQCVQPNDENV